MRSHCITCKARQLSPLSLCHCNEFIYHLNSTTFFPSKLTWIMLKLPMAPSELSILGTKAILIWLAFIVAITCAELTTLSSPSLRPSTTYEPNLSLNSVATSTSQSQMSPTDNIFVTSTNPNSYPAGNSITGYRYPTRPLFQNETFHSEAFIIDLTVNWEENGLHFVCWYPISVCASRLLRNEFRNGTSADLAREIIADYPESYFM